MRQTCPVKNCSKRGTTSALNQHARAVHPGIDREIYRRAVQRNLLIDDRGILLSKPSAGTLYGWLRYLFRKSRMRIAAIGSNALSFLMVVTFFLLFLEKNNSIF